jgi:SAM-dependent methyltransferase
MDDVAEEFARFVSSIPTQTPRVPIVSSVTGQATDVARLRDAGYWRDQVRQRVRFEDAMATLAAADTDLFVEIGPAPVLTGMASQTLRAGSLAVASMRREQDAAPQMLESLAQLYARGATVDWKAFYAASRGRRIELPTYPFEHQRYWLDEREPVAAASVWDSVHDGTAWQASQGRLDLSVDRYARGWPELAQLTAAYIATTLVSLGAFQAAGERHTVESLLEKTGIQTGFAKLAKRWLDCFVDLSVLRSTSAGYVADRPLERPDIDARLRAARAVFGDDHIILDYVVACGARLAAYVTGATSTLETLFPGGRFDRAEDLYERAPLSAYFAGIGRAAVESFVRARGAAPIRAIEIGAGTGATTSALLPVLPRDRSEYHFTDLSDFFLNHARDKFARYGFMNYGVFNVEDDASDERYAEASFDLVVATNVLHATRDIRATLKRVRALLAPGGLVVLCEATTYLPWFDITTALIEGWQLFEDGLRGDNPLLPADEWTRLLGESGFDQVAAFPQRGSPAEVLGQHVMLAHVAGTPGRTAVRRASTTASDAASMSATAAPVPGVRARLSAASASERRELLVSLIRGQLAHSLRVADPSSLERKRRLIDFGIDSLMAVEVRNRLASALELAEPLPATLLFEHPSIDALAVYLERDVLGLGDDDQALMVEAVPGRGAARAAEVEDMSEEAAEALLLRRLQSL